MEGDFRRDFKKTIRELIKKPLKFHHQDIHEELYLIKKKLSKLENKLDKLL